MPEGLVKYLSTAPVVAAIWMLITAGILIEFNRFFPDLLLHPQGYLAEPLKQQLIDSKIPAWCCRTSRYFIGKIHLAQTPGFSFNDQ